MYYRKYIYYEQFIAHNSLAPTTTLNHDMQATNSPLTMSHLSQCNLTITLGCGELASTVNEYEFCFFMVVKREECICVILLPVSLGGNFVFSYQRSNLLNQSITQKLKKGAFQYDKPSSTSCQSYSTVFTPIVMYVISKHFPIRNNLDNFLLHFTKPTC